jgi:hypothetical protein
MTLKACKECMAQISSEADSCPSCGASQYMIRWKILLIGLIAIPVIGGVVDGVSQGDKPQQTVAKQTAPKTCPETMDERIEAAAKAVASKSPAGVMAAYKGCENYIPTGQHRATYDKAVVEVVKAEKAAKKLAGVQIGMYEQDVLDSSWGKPLRVNTTTNARGLSAQWVYGGKSYLYFDNGVLTSISN